MRFTVFFTVALRIVTGVVTVSAVVMVVLIGATAGTATTTGGGLLSSVGTGIGARRLFGLCPCTLRHTDGGIGDLRRAIGVFE